MREDRQLRMRRHATLAKVRWLVVTMVRYNNSLLPRVLRVHPRAYHHYPNVLCHYFTSRLESGYQRCDRKG